MKFSWNKIKKPVIVLAPMANITTLPFRSICREMGADIVFTPMISSNALIHNANETLKIAEFLSDEQPVIVQVFGYDGNLIAKAVNIIDNALHPDGIDINMGCPAPKIAKNECGAALLKNYKKAKEIIKIIRDNFNGQLSVKLRLGWDKFDVLPFAEYLEDIGINAISVHGRTAKQGYSGKADWNAIYKIAESVKIPVIGNGDIGTQLSTFNFQLATKNKLGGIMIGRGALGNPWIFKEIKEIIARSSQKGLSRRAKADVHSIGAPSASNGASDPLFVSELANDKKNMHSGNIPRFVEKNDLIKIINLQTKRYINYAGEKVAIMEMRKHLGWYIKGFPGALEIRKKAMLVKTYNDVKKVLEMIK